MEKFKLNLLGNELINIIKQRTNVFNQITIVVPNNKIEQWFKAYWLKHENNVLMNVVFKRIDNALKDLVDCDRYFELIRLDQLKTLIMKHLPNILDLLPDEVKDYIYVEGEFHHIKLYDLSNKLAALFIEYEIASFNFSPLFTPCPMMEEQNILLSFTPNLVINAQSCSAISLFSEECEIKIFFL